MYRILERYDKRAHTKTITTKKRPSISIPLFQSQKHPIPLLSDSSVCNSLQLKRKRNKEVGVKKTQKKRYPFHYHYPNIHLFLSLSLFYSLMWGWGEN